MIDVIDKIHQSRYLIGNFQKIRNLRKNQKKSLQELEIIQLRKLKKLVKYSYECSPYYHDLFKEANFRSEDLHSIEDLKKIPISSKLDVKNNYERLITRNLDDSNHFSYTTSGSSGVPMTLFHDYESHFYAFANLLYCFNECGVKFYEKFVDLFSMPFKDGSLVSRPISSRLHFLGLNLNIIKLSVYSYSEFVGNINRIKPDVLYAMPNDIVDMCYNKMIDISPRLVFTHGEVLTDNSRDIIENTWNTEVYNTYGSSEFPRIAFECSEHQGLHILSDSVSVETIKDGEIVNGEPGDVVITGLYNFLMPLIRYELGDIATLTDVICSCGRNWPLIKEIQGRSNDVFPLPSGRILNRSHTLGWFKPEINENLLLISKYQLIQEKKNKINLKIVKGKKFDKSMMDSIISKIHDFFGDEELDFEVIFVDDIPKEKSGKRRTMISKFIDIVP